MNKRMILIFQGLLFFSLKLSGSETETLNLYVGYLTQVHCKGRLFLSSVGDPNLVRWEAFPKELGCGVVLKPKGAYGSTDLLLKTSTGDSHFILNIQKSPISVRPDQLEFQVGVSELKGGV